MVIHNGGWEPCIGCHLLFCLKKSEEKPVFQYGNLIAPAKPVASLPEDQKLWGFQRQQNSSIGPCKLRSLLNPMQPLFIVPWHLFICWCYGCWSMLALDPDTHGHPYQLKKHSVLMCWVFKHTDRHLWRINLGSWHLWTRTQTIGDTEAMAKTHFCCLLSQV